jgi:regulator of cell morphogenesis and NO signaling
VLDVRDLAPRFRHPKIFEAFDRLGPGETFVLVNDHDPKPLYYQFQFERPGAVRWRYLEQGPEVWRVEIGKAGAAVGADRTVEEIVRDEPGVRAVMADMGINHCCGAHLTLREAAAAAGLSVEAVLQALESARRVRA